MTLQNRSDLVKLVRAKKSRIDIQLFKGVRTDFSGFGDPRFSATSFPRAVPQHRKRACACRHHLDCILAELVPKMVSDILWLELPDGNEGFHDVRRLDI